MHYIQLHDAAVEHRWVCTQIPDVCSAPGEVTVPPTFYEVNGTPVCECGIDMEYDGTFLDLASHFGALTAKNIIENAVKKGSL